MKLFTIEDQNRLAEARRISEKRVVQLANILVTGRVTEAKQYDIGDEFISEAYKLEKITIVEAVSDQDFNQLQKNFRSLLRPAGSLVKNLPGTDLSKKLDMLRTTGIELLSDMYEDVKDVEGGISNPVKNKEVSAARDKFAKTFADFAILIKGAMALGDLFSEDPTSVGGYTAMKEIISSLETDDLLSVPLKDAFAAYEQSVKDNSLNQAEKDDMKDADWFSQGDNIDWVSDTSGGEVPAGKADMMARPRHAPKNKKPGFFARLFGKKQEGLEGYPVLTEFADGDEAPPTQRGGFVTKQGASQTAADPFPMEKDPFAGKPAKQSHLEKKFRQLLQKTMLEKSPGFAKMINIPELVDAIMYKSYDHVAAIFGRFNDLVSSDIDVDFLKSAVNKPLSVSGALKSVWDTFSGGSTGRGLTGRAG